MGSGLRVHIGRPPPLVHHRRHRPHQPAHLVVEAGGDVVFELSQPRLGRLFQRVEPGI